jgi:KaiC/GvpD/RAD55 family RecA-like ATPase
MKVVDHKAKYLTPKDIMALEIKQNQFLIRPIICRGCVTTVMGTPGVGKTWFILEIARCVTSGGNLFHMLDTEHGTVAYFDQENPMAVLKDRIELLNIHDEGLHIYHFQNFDIERDYKQLSTIARGVDLVVFDSLIQFHGRNENKSDEMKIVMGLLKRIAEGSNCAVLVIHQMNKQTSTHVNELFGSRGSGQIMYDSDMAFVLRDLGDNERLLRCLKSRIVQTPPGIRFDIKEVEDGKVELEYLGESHVYENKQQLAKTFIPLILKEELDPIPLEDILRRLSDNRCDISEGTIRPILRELVAAGIIEEDTREHGRKYYSYPLPEDGEGGAGI